MVSLISTPATNSNSRWSAVFNPIVFEYQRLDYAISQTSLILNSDGTNQLDIKIPAIWNSDELASHLNLKITVKTSQYSFTAPIAALMWTPGYNVFSVNNVDTSGAVTTSTTNDGYMSIYGLNANSKIRTEVTWGYDGASNIFTADHTPNLSGYCRADISKYLRTLLQPQDDFDYSLINYRDANISASYTVRYCEVVNGVESTWLSAGDPFYVTYSAMQIGNKTGGNMSPYVTRATAGQISPAKFINDFKVPRFYTDMPFDLSFIYSENVVGQPLKLSVTGVDVNGVNIGAAGAISLLNENGSVLLNQDGSKLLIEKAAPMTIYSKLGLNRLVFTQAIPLGSVYIDAYLFYTNTSGVDVQVTEKRRLLLDNSPCNGLPYEYLKWMGSSGGWLYYMFIKNQLHELNTKNQVIFEKFISDYATADSSQQQSSIDAQQTITVGVNDVSVDEATVLSTILYAPKVYRLVDKATNQWQAVIIDTKSLKMYQTYGGIGDFEIRLLLPELNVQRA